MSCKVLSQHGMQDVLHEYGVVAMLATAGLMGCVLGVACWQNVSVWVESKREYGRWVRVNGTYVMVNMQSSMNDCMLVEHEYLEHEYLEREHLVH